MQIIATSGDVTLKISEISDHSRPKLSQFSDPALGSVLLETPGTLFGYLTQIGAFWLRMLFRHSEAPELAPLAPKTPYLAQIGSVLTWALYLAPLAPTNTLSDSDRLVLAKNVFSSTQKLPPVWPQKHPTWSR